MQHSSLGLTSCTIWWVKRIPLETLETLGGKLSGKCRMWVLMTHIYSLQFPCRYPTEENINQVEPTTVKPRQHFPLIQPEPSRDHSLLHTNDKPWWNDNTQLYTDLRIKMELHLHSQLVNIIPKGSQVASLFKTFSGYGCQTAAKSHRGLQWWGQTSVTVLPGTLPCAQSCCWSQVGSSGWWRGRGGGPVGSFCP